MQLPDEIPVIGGGLAGSEAAWQLAERGFRVALHEMRPRRPTPAHKTDRLAELGLGSRELAAAERAGRLVRLAEGVVTVTDDEIRAAMVFALERLKLVLEPSGAAALAAILSGKLDVRNRTVAIVASGGNVDADAFAQILAQ